MHPPLLFPWTGFVVSKKHKSEPMAGPPRKSITPVAATLVSMSKEGGGGGCPPLPLMHPTPHTPRAPVSQGTGPSPQKKGSGISAHKDSSVPGKQKLLCESCCPAAPAPSTTAVGPPSPHRTQRFLYGPTVTFRFGRVYVRHHQTLSALVICKKKGSNIYIVCHLFSICFKLS